MLDTMEFVGFEVGFPILPDGSVMVESFKEPMNIPDRLEFENCPQLKLAYATPENWCGWKTIRFGFLSGYGIVSGAKSLFVSGRVLLKQNSGGDSGPKLQKSLRN